MPDSGASRATVVAVLVAMLAIVATRGQRAAAQGGAVNPPAPPDTAAVTPQMIAEGRQLFHGRGTCFACHGMKLEGGPIAPPLTAHQWKSAKGGELDAIYYVDTHGVSGTMMFAHPGGISDAEAGRIAAYIWAVSHRGAQP